MAAHANIDFYDKMKDLQSAQYQREQERLTLEQKMVAGAKPSNQTTRLRAARLQAMWKRVCEDEQKSMRRNEEIIHEFDRVESHMQMLANKTEKLQLVRKQYMEYVASAYPQWQMTQKQQQQHPVAADASHPVATTSTGPPQQHVQQGRSAETTPTKQQQIKSETVSRKQVAQPPQAQATTTAQSVESFITPRSASAQATAPDIVMPSLPHRQMDLDLDVYFDEEPLSNELAPAAVSSNEARIGPPPVLQPPRIEVDNQPEFAREQTRPQQAPSSVIEPEVTSFKQREIERSRPERLESPRSDHHKRLNSPIREVAVKEEHGEVIIPTLQLGSTDGTGVTVGTGTLSDQMTDLLGSVQTTTKTPRIELLDSTLSPRLMASGEMADDGLHMASGYEAGIDSTSEQHQYVLTDLSGSTLSLDGICLLLRVVAEYFSVAFNPETFYRCERPDDVTRSRLIYNANRGDDLNQYDPSSASIVIMEELPGVCQDLPGGCMVRDDVLDDLSFMVKDIVFRAKMTTDGRQLWDALYDHMKQAIAHGVLSPREMAQMVAPCLLRPRSSNREKIITVVTSLLQTFNEDDSQMSDFSSQLMSPKASPSKQSLTSASPSKDSVTAASPSKHYVTAASPSKTSLTGIDNIRAAGKGSPSPSKTSKTSLSGQISVSGDVIGGYGKSERAISPRDISTSDDDFFDKSTPRFEPQRQLAGSAAYQSMLMSSGGTRMKSSMTSSAYDDDDDDIEDALALAPKGPGARKSPSPTNQKPFTGDVTVATPYDDDVSIVSTPTVSLSTGRADKHVYVPTALESSGPSTVSAVGYVPSKPGFLQRLNSDADFSDTEEVDIPMTGTRTAARAPQIKVTDSLDDDSDGFFD